MIEMNSHLHKNEKSQEYIMFAERSEQSTEQTGRLTILVAQFFPPFSETTTRKNNFK